MGSPPMSGRSFEFTVDAPPYVKMLFPTNAITLLLLISLFTQLVLPLVLPWSSHVTSFSWRPLMPPTALQCFTNASTPCTFGLNWLEPKGLWTLETLPITIALPLTPTSEALPPVPPGPQAPAKRLPPLTLWPPLDC